MEVFGHAEYFRISNVAARVSWQAPKRQEALPSIQEREEVKKCHHRQQPEIHLPQRPSDIDVSKLQILLTLMTAITHDLLVERTVITT